MIHYGHELLTDEQLSEFLDDPSDRCPVCGEPMTHKQNPIPGSDSWWFTCPNGHATWVGK